MMMSRKRRQIGWVMRSGLTISTALLLASSGLVAVAKAIVIEKQSAPTANQSGKPSESGAPCGPVYKIAKGVSAPIPILTPEAEFPSSAKGLNKPFSSKVLVGLVVDKNGLPQNLHIVRSYKSDFDAEAMKAVKLYRFKPAQRAGQPVAVVMCIEVNFTKY